MRYLRGRPDARDRGDRPHMGQGHRETTEPTATKEGVRTYTCTNMRAIEYAETVAALGTSTEQKKASAGKRLEWLERKNRCQERRAAQDG